MDGQKNIQAFKKLFSGAGSVYFIGIGGIGMSAIARFFHSRGAAVSGYDRVSTPLTKQMEQEGIAIHYEERTDLIPDNPELVVYTPAIPKSNAEYIYVADQNYTVVKRSDVLQLITEHSFNICVAGSHGKTTITTMIAHILRHSGYGCNAFLGGISANYDTNFWSSENNVSVVEADEYDRSFLKLVPDVAVITSIDPDHLDIYGSAHEVENAFIQFSQKIKPDGYLITKYGLNRSAEFIASNQDTYSLKNEHATVFAKNIKVENGSYHFDVCHKQWELNQVVLHMGGLHNIENSIAAIMVAKYLNISDEKIKAAVDAFKGVKRRFEYILNQPAQVLIDDYAHHPEELKALISGVRSLYGNQKFTIIFQPHLFSRTRDLAKEFAESLDLADEVILLPVYPARELEIPGVSSKLIADQMVLKNKKLLSKAEMLEWVKKEKPALVAMAGAGDIEALIQPVKEVLVKGEK